MNLEEAIDYLNYCEKEGVSVDIEGLSDEEIIKLAERMANQGEAYADAVRKGEL